MDVNEHKNPSDIMDGFLHEMIVIAALTASGVLST
jgi:hypothetical protein